MRFRLISALLAALLILSGCGNQPKLPELHSLEGASALRRTGYIRNGYCYSLYQQLLDNRVEQLPVYFLPQFSEEEQALCNDFSERLGLEKDSAVTVRNGNFGGERRI